MWGLQEANASTLRQLQMLCCVEKVTVLGIGANVNKSLSIQLHHPMLTISAILWKAEKWLGYNFTASHPLFESWLPYEPVAST